MSISHSDVAAEHGKGLPAFPDEETARGELFRQRDQYLAMLQEAGNAADAFQADFTPESLKTLEHWYFDLWESQAFFEVGMGRSEFERAMGMYFGEVVVRNSAGFEWIVDAYTFEPGKYEIGVRRERLALMLMSLFADLFARPNEKGKQGMWRMYDKYCGQEA